MIPTPSGLASVHLPETRRRFWSPATLIIIAVTATVFAAYQHGLQHIPIASSALIQQGGVVAWPATTMPSLLLAIFLHVDPPHIMSNMMVLFIVGRYMEAETGWWRYLLFYVAAGVSGNILTALLGPQGTVSAGASGAIFGIIGYLVIRWSFWRPPVWTLGTVWLWSLLGLNLVITFTNPAIAIWAHLGGLGFGVVMASLLLYRDWRRDPRGFSRRLRFGIVVDGRWTKRVDLVSQWEGRLGLEPYAAVFAFRPRWIKVLTYLVVFGGLGILYIIVGTALMIQGSWGQGVPMAVSGFVMMWTFLKFGGMARAPFIRVSRLGIELGRHVKIPWDAVASISAANHTEILFVAAPYWYLRLKDDTAPLVQRRTRWGIQQQAVPIPFLFLSRRERHRAQTALLAYASNLSLLDAGDPCPRQPELLAMRRPSPTAAWLEPETSTPRGPAF